MLLRKIAVAAALSLALVAPSLAQTGGTGNAQTAPLAPVAPATATATKSMLAGGQYNAVLPTFTTGQQGALQLDSSGRLVVVVQGTPGLPADAATQTTLAAVLAKLSSDPATGAKQDTGNTSVATTATNTGTTATNTGTVATNTGTTNTNLGAPGATACATDTASCSVNQFLQRIAQRLSSLITALGTPLQAGGNVVVTSSGLPTGAATSANQSTEIASLASLDTKSIARSVTSATQASVAGSATSVTLLASNASRKPGSTIVNDSTAILYISLSGAASTTNFWAAVDGKSTVGGIASLPDGFTGAVTGIWASAAGSARVTEMQ